MNDKESLEPIKKFISGIEYEAVPAVISGCCDGCAFRNDQRKCGESMVITTCIGASITGKDIVWKPVKQEV
jgi:hypothetical protein